MNDTEEGKDINTCLTGNFLLKNSDKTEILIIVIYLAIDVVVKMYNVSHAKTNKK